ncbi:MAG: hypothetical protein ACJ76V_06775 [Thermoleophilaceae bacterium]
MKLEQPRAGVFQATMTAHELSVLLAGARMSLNVMQSGDDIATAEATQALEAVLADFDVAIKRATAERADG